MDGDYRFVDENMPLVEFAEMVAAVEGSEDEQNIARRQLLHFWKQNGIWTMKDIMWRVKVSEPVANKVMLEQRVRFLVRRQPASEVFTKWLNSKRKQEKEERCRKIITDNLNALLKKKDLHLRSQRSEWLRRENAKKRMMVNKKTTDLTAVQPDTVVSSVKVEKAKHSYRLWLLEHQPSSKPKPSSIITGRKEWDASPCEPVFDVDDAYYPP
eukprot:TRINITY_DN14258_c0_g1_i1.p1 TRINITY_DN14258_c0_g1~~TRINITY_DN14258_c0_g1_i1.p1  ORF type:complete len:226 (+),score=40.32 TRINITY_DN14258_c0_g1_i1:43-678(+)